MATSFLRLASATPFTAAVLKNKLAEEGRTMLLVTHELGFAYHFATKVIFLADGVFHEVGTPDEVLKNPRKPRTRDFLRRFGEFAF